MNKYDELAALRAFYEAARALAEDLGIPSADDVERVLGGTGNAVTRFWDAYRVVDKERV